MARNPVPKPAKINPIALSTAELDEMRARVESHFAPYIPEPPALATKPLGRPTTYDPAFCEILLKDAALGHTVGATAALIGVSRQTLNEWAVSYPAFGAALARGKAMRQRFYEGHLIDITRRGGDSTRMSAIKLALINVGAEDWKERLTSEHNVTFSLGNLITESLKLGAPLIEGELAANEEKTEPDAPQD